MSLFSEALVLNSGLQRRVPVRLGFMHLNAVTEFETEAVLLKNGAEDQSFLLKHGGGTISAVTSAVAHGRSRAALQASFKWEDTNLPLSPKDCWMLAASS